MDTCRTEKTQYIHGVLLQGVRRFGVVHQKGSKTQGDGVNRFKTGRKWRNDLGRGTGQQTVPSLGWGAHGARIKGHHCLCHGTSSLSPDGRQQV